MADDGEEFGGIGGAALSEPEEGTDKEDDEQSDATEYPRSHGKHGILDGLRDMQDAAELYQSSSFKLQVWFSLSIRLEKHADITLHR